jgi:RHS repeat-associated protein
MFQSTSTLDYTLTDHASTTLSTDLDSIDAICDENGDVVERYSYDAWGNRRHQENWFLSDTRTNFITNRGYTGHEHLDVFGLINANARIYEPATGRFLTPDPYIQAPDFSQNYNRYSYCWNNPLSYTDPDGEWVHIVVGAAIGGVINLAMNWNNIDSFWEGAAVFGIGAGAGAATAATGNAGFWVAATTAAVGGAATSATNNIVAQTGNGVGLNQVNWGQVGVNAGVGAISGFAGYAAGTFASNTLGGAVINSTHVGSPIAKGMIGGGIGGFAGGYVGGFTGGYIMTGDIGSAHQAGISGMWQGAAIGTVAGGISGYAYAKQNNLNPLTGKPNRSIVIGRDMDNWVNPIAEDLGAETISNDWNKAVKENVFHPNDRIGGRGFNKEWIIDKTQLEYHIYDVGQNPASQLRPSLNYSMETSYIGSINYPSVYRVSYYNLKYFDLRFYYYR